MTYDEQCLHVCSVYARSSRIFALPHSVHIGGVAGNLLHPSCFVRCEERHAYRRLPNDSAKVRLRVQSWASMSSRMAYLTQLLSFPNAGCTTGEHTSSMPDTVPTSFGIYVGEYSDGSVAVLATELSKYSWSCTTGIMTNIQD